MTKHILLALSNPADGADDAYNEWYDGDHRAEIFELPGFAAVQRFKLSDTQARGHSSEHRYVSIYEIEGDPADALNRLMDDVEAGHIVLPPEVDARSIRLMCFEPITERATAPQA
jgi:hypothetical protein